MVRICLFQVSECSKSEGPSLSTSPGSDYLTSPAHRPIPLASRQFSRTSSRASQSSLQSPSKSTGSSPPKTGSSNSLNKFHNRLVDKLKRSLKKADDNSEDQRNLSWDNQAVLSRPPASGSKPIEFRRTSAPSGSGTSLKLLARSCPDPDPDPPVAWWAKYQRVSFLGRVDNRSRHRGQQSSFFLFYLGWIGNARMIK